MVTVSLYAMAAAVAVFGGALLMLLAAVGSKALTIICVLATIIAEVKLLIKIVTK